MTATTTTNTSAVATTPQLSGYRPQRGACRRSQGFTHDERPNAQHPLVRAPSSEASADSAPAAPAPPGVFLEDALLPVAFYTVDRSRAGSGRGGGGGGELLRGGPRVSVSARAAGQRPATTGGTGRPSPNNGGVDLGLVETQAFPHHHCHHASRGLMRRLEHTDAELSASASASRASPSAVHNLPPYVGIQCMVRARRLRGPSGIPACSARRACVHGWSFPPAVPPTLPPRGGGGRARRVL